MKNRLLNLFLAMFCLWSEYSTAQVIDTTNYNPGIWHAFGDPSVSEQPKIRGRLSNFSWSDLETAPGVWDWTAFDSDLINRTKDGLPVIFMVFVRSPEKNAPDWLYSSGVPK